MFFTIKMHIFVYTYLCTCVPLNANHQKDLLRVLEQEIPKFLQSTDLSFQFNNTVPSVSLKAEFYRWNSREWTMALRWAVPSSREVTSSLLVKVHTMMCHLLPYLLYSFALTHILYISLQIPVFHVEPY
jgi:hypothetical protein